MIGPSRLLATGAVSAVAMAVAGGAAAATPGPPTDVSAIAQYVETLPAGGGPSAVGGGHNRRAPLSPSVRIALRTSGGGDAAALATAASSSAYGAPAPVRHRTLPGSSRTLAPAPAQAERRPSPLSAAADALAGDRVLPLALLLVLGTALVGGAAYAGSRRPV